MDTKDIAVRMIIYGEQELENWSRRIVGREMGLEELPTIREMANNALHHFARRNTVDRHTEP